MTRSLPRRPTVALALALWGCGAELSSVRAETAAATPVAVYYNGSTPEVPYRAVGTLHVRSVGGTLAEVVAQAQARARQLCADAILIDLRYHYQSLPVFFDEAGQPYVEPTPRLNARVVALSFDTRAR